MVFSVLENIRRIICAVYYEISLKIDLNLGPGKGVVPFEFKKEKLYLTGGVQ